MKRRNFTAKFKTKVVLEAIKEQKTLAQIAQHHTLAPTQISKWKKEFLSSAAKYKLLSFEPLSLPLQQSIRFLRHRLPASCR
ncbi:MAG: transposase-like protein [Saprospiraceae bacterium]|jgi:transposase-like protein